MVQLFGKNGFKIVKCLSSNFSKYDHIIRWCLEDVLKLEGYDLKVTFCVLQDCAGKFLKPNEIQINNQHLDDSNTIRTLLHEVRHYYQYITDMFDFDFGKYTTFKDRENEDYEDYASFRDYHLADKIRLDAYLSYLKYPWELDAQKFSTETYGKYLRFGRDECKKFIWQGNYENYDNGG